MMNINRLINIIICGIFRMISFKNRRNSGSPIQLFCQSLHPIQEFHTYFHRFNAFNSKLNSSSRIAWITFICSCINDLNKPKNKGISRFMNITFTDVLTNWPRSFVYTAFKCIWIASYILFEYVHFYRIRLLKIPCVRFFAPFLSDLFPFISINILSLWWKLSDNLELKAKICFS